MAKTTINNGMVESDVKLNGKVVVITGCNTGIGFENALDLSRRGARVIMACRDTTRAETAKAKILEQVKDADLVVKHLDLASLESVRACAKDINQTESRLDILINNAGVSVCPYWKTKEGFEMQIGVNHIGHFLFTNLLLDLIKKSAPSRIVIVSSLAHHSGKMNWDDIMSEKSYDGLVAYGQSKLANVLHCKELSRRLEGTGVTAYSIHPGYVQTELGRHVGPDLNPSYVSTEKMQLLKKRLASMTPLTPLQGSQTTLYCAIAPELEKESGKYYTDCKEAPAAEAATNMEDAKKLWELSEKWTSK